MRRRLNNEVDELLSHTRSLQRLAMSPDPLVASLHTARSAVRSLRTELDVWGLLEVRPGRGDAAVEVLLEVDITEELRKHGLVLEPAMAVRLASLRRGLLDEKGHYVQGRDRNRDRPDPPSGDDGLPGLLDLALKVIDDVLRDADPDDARWQKRAKTVLKLISDLLSNLVLAIVAVGLSMLAVDDTFGKEITKKVIEILTAMVGLEAVRAVREKTRPPDIAEVLAPADRGIRAQSRDLLAAMQNIASNEGRPAGERVNARRALTCLHGHVYTARRLLELADTSEWPQFEGYLETCGELLDLGEEAVEAARETSLLNRWRMRRGIVRRLDHAVVTLATFDIPDTLPLQLGD
ncbi:hypothetical protein [Actinomadura meridiana]|uniref:hypothetical protein n=1 Tax=Actinomadura meridiana TaxID=559626 RepID=UPI0031E8C035